MPDVGQQKRAGIPGIHHSVSSERGVSAELNSHLLRVPYSTTFYPKAPRLRSGIIL